MGQERVADNHKMSEMKFSRSYTAPPDPALCGTVVGLKLPLSIGPLIFTTVSD